MAGTKNSRTRRGAIAAGVVALAALLGSWLLWVRHPPQMGADEDVFATVDALFTAVTARDQTLLGKCEQRLHALKVAGKLPSNASDYLDGVLKKAHDDRWESAAETLYQFMSAQRREGASESSRKGHKTRGAAK